MWVITERSLDHVHSHEAIDSTNNAISLLLVHNLFEAWCIIELNLLFNFDLSFSSTPLTTSVVLHEFSQSIYEGFLNN